MVRVFLVLFLLILPARAFALAGDWSEDKVVSARLISGVEAVGEDAVVPLGLEINLAKGWHTYWRSPGQAGLPPHLDWSQSFSTENNLRSADLLFPAPRRSFVFGLETVGYSDRVVFPIDAVLREPGKPLKARVIADLLLCQSICVPAHFDLALSVPAGSPSAGAEASLLKRAREQLPVSSHDSGILLKKAATDGRSLFLTVSSRERIHSPDVFIENDKDIGFSAPEVEIDPSGFNAVLTVRPVDFLPDGVSLDSLPLTVTLLNAGHATEFKNPVVAVLPPPPPFVPERPSYGLLLIVALLGGFILNLMPCVLPVLSLKIVGAVSHGGGDVRNVRLSFLATAAGIVFSFCILALATIVFKELGMTLGWGMQFQQPSFLILLVILLTFFAANLWGLYEISLPGFLADKLEGAYSSKLAGDFVTGAFATLLATPCSAPFLGTAVGFALAAGSLEIFSVFTVLGIGMALPYFVVALFPKSATLLPKPGRWMVVLRASMG
ncbi:MAG: protein-disulfide reductase DsbD family protein, partial [Alphaproteobacteria bacterium]|nr:protein-disulfide reductase DsbD family protein [Alphaproteobacteria bacterium]